jgi:hypothetical protein
MPAVDLMRNIFGAIVYFILFPQVNSTSDEVLVPFEQGYCFTVEIANSEDISLLSNPLIATSLLSLSYWKLASVADHDVQPCIITLTDDSFQSKSPAFMDSRYKTMLTDESL